MKKVQFQVGGEGVLQLRQASGDAAVKGWDEDVVELTVDGELEECVVEQQEGLLAIDSQVPFSVSVPRNMTVRVDRVRGDLVLYELDGEVSVDQVDGECSLRSGAARVSVRAVRGDLTIEEMGGPLTVGEVKGDVRLTDLDAAVELGQVSGDVRTRGIGGELKIGTVDGDARVRQVEGLLTLEQVRGDLKGVDLQGGMNVALAKGDLSLKTPLTPGMAYVGRASGNVDLRVPGDASARFTLEAQGGISTRLLRVEEKESGRVVGQMGDGEAQVTLWAGQHLSLKPSDAWAEDAEGFPMDWGESIAAQVEARIAEQLAGADLDEITRSEIEKAMHKAWGKAAESRRRALERSRRAEERARRAQERMRKAQEKAERKARKIALKVERHARSRERRAREKSRGWSVSANVGRKTARPQVSEEEQLAILRMLQEGKITTGEAEMLFKALEG